MHAHTHTHTHTHMHARTNTHTHTHTNTNTNIITVYWFTHYDVPWIIHVTITDYRYLIHIYVTDVIYLVIMTLLLSLNNSITTCLPTCKDLQNINKWRTKFSIKIRVSWSSEKLTSTDLSKLINWLDRIGCCVPHPPTALLLTCFQDKKTGFHAIPPYLGMCTWNGSESERQKESVFVGLRVRVCIIKAVSSITLFCKDGGDIIWYTGNSLHTHWCGPYNQDFFNIIKMLIKYYNLSH
jgi:hypothetical protein